MDRYLILIAGPLVSRDKAYAEELCNQLKGSSVIACHALFPQLHDLESAKAITIDEARRNVESIAAEEYLIVYGDNLLALEPMRALASLRLYVEADELAVTSDALQDLQTEALQERKAGRKDSRKPSTLAQDVQRIINERNARIESQVAVYRSFADIIIGAEEQPDEAIPSIVRYIQRTDSRKSRQKLQDEAKQARVEEMLRQYNGSTAQTRKAKLKRKLWTMVVKATLFFKRLMDIVISLVALLLLSPLFAFVAICIKLTDGGPVFYVQTRIGKQGKAFPFPKFRSMVMNADKMKDGLLGQADRKGDVTFKMKHDPRVTRIGRFIRRFSIDELPQVWCVLKGDMSIVGPRPPVPREVALYTQEDRRRLEVTPGLTGIWQVSGRAEIGFKQQVELDVLYIESHGFWLDLKLILKTIPAVLTGKGAY
jgi:exopolysaccharide biosynthesis polyprenyl glycosylphosphotransferase